MGALAIAAFSLLNAAPIKLATAGFTHTGLSAEQAAYYTEHFAVKLAEDPGFAVATSKDLAAIIGLERQKALLGCSDAASQCMAELAGALGVAGVVTGQLARVGSGFQLSVKVLAADGSKLLFVHASELLSSEEELLAEVTRIAALTAARLRQVLGVPEATGQTGTSRSAWRLAPVAVGAIALGVGAGLAAAAAGRYGALSRSLDEGTPPPDFLQQAAAGRSEQLIGLAVGGVGLAAAAAGALWYALGSTSPGVVAYLGPGGAGVSVAWEIP